MIWLLGILAYLAVGVITARVMNRVDPFGENAWMAVLFMLLGPLNLLLLFIYWLTTGGSANTLGRLVLWRWKR